MKKGFTLVETLIAVTVSGLVMAGVLVFFMDVLKNYAWERSRVKINSDIRKLTQVLTQDAAYANYFRIYPTFGNRTTDGTTDAPATDGTSGDFLVLFTTIPDLQDVKTKQKITRIVAYYRDATGTAVGPVRRVTLDFSAAPIDPTTTTMLAILNQKIPTGSRNDPVIVQLAQGLSNGTLFYNFYNRSIMVRGQIQEQTNNMTNNNATSTYKSDTAASTYNFTISPRG